jgi:hypothetical protein
MLGSLSEADDAVQEALIRPSRADTGGVAAWATGGQMTSRRMASRVPVMANAMP